MFDPRHRLDWLAPGDRFHADRATVARAFARAEWEDRKDPVSTHKQPVEHKVKPSSHLAEVAPYAPQLIRVVRHPFAMSGVAFKKEAGVDRKLVMRPTREPFGAAVAALLLEERAPFPKPSEVRDRLLPRERPSCEAFLKARKGDR